MKKILIALALAMAVAGCSTSTSVPQKWEYNTLLLSCLVFDQQLRPTSNFAATCWKSPNDKTQKIDAILSEMGNQSWELVSSDIRLTSDSGVDFGPMLIVMVFKRPK